MSILLTEKAATEIKKIVKEQGLPETETRLRVGVKGGGCSGFSYMLDLTEEPAGDMDEEQESHGIKILVDAKSLLYLSGTEIDFKDEIMGRGFVFKNPNATSTCGCGSSFQA
jgi:iron-sulfur cluster assembly protein